MPKKLTTITEGQLVKDIAFSTGESQSAVKVILAAFKDEVTEHLVSGNKVTLTKFATFTPRYVKGKKRGEEGLLFGID